MDRLKRGARTSAYLVSGFLAIVASRPSTAGASTIACNIPQPCALYQNAQGFGLEGTSARSSGLAGVTTFNATSLSAGVAAIKGNDSSTNGLPYNSGVFGFSARGYGTLGKSTTGTGILGASVSANGIVGQTSGTATSPHHAGVVGTDLATNYGYNDGVLGTVTNGGYGVEGTSGNGGLGGVHGLGTSGIGVVGQSTTSKGVYGYSTSDVGVYGNVGTGGVGVQGYAPNGTSGYFVTSTGTALNLYAASGLGAYVRNSNGNATDIEGSYIGLLGRSAAYPLTLTDATGKTVVYSDSAGNLFARSFNYYAAAASNMVVTAFATKSTTSNVEDVGSAALVGGNAIVKLDAAFAASMDPGAAYQVFLTPGGDSRGLFVATKTRTGFIVREAQGGRGSFSFDYRIVGRALGQARDRMALATPQMLHVPNAALVAPPAVKPVSPPESNGERSGKRAKAQRPSGA